MAGWKILILVLSISGLVASQKNACKPDSQHRCIHKFSYLECEREGDTHERAVESCADDLVCYGGTQDENQVCGPEPPKCPGPGNYAVPDRPYHFYTCTSIGHDEYGICVSACQPGNEFSSAKGYCVPVKIKTALRGQVKDDEATSESSSTSATSESSTTSATSESSAISATSARSTTSATSESSATSATPTQGSTTVILTSSTGSMTSTVSSVTSTTTLERCSPWFFRSPDPTSCRHFYQCLFGRKVRLQCPIRRLFDLTNKDCRRNVECGERPRSILENGNPVFE